MTVESIIEPDAAAVVVKKAPPLVSNPFMEAVEDAVPLL